MYPESKHVHMYLCSNVCQRMLTPTRLRLKINENERQTVFHLVINLMFILNLT